MLENVRYLRTLTKETRFHALLSIDKGTPKNFIDDIQAEAELLFAKVHTFVYPTLPPNPWPIPQNEAFQHTARYLEMFARCSWLWYESDAVALRPEWLELIYEEYMKAKKPFMGNIVQGVLPGGHMNGVGVYPFLISRFAPTALMCRTTAWDVAMSPKTIPHTHSANHLIQHVWTENAKASMTAESRDQPVVFEDWAKVEKIIDFRCALMHRSKDGSLIKRLNEHFFGDNPTEKNVPQLNPPKQSIAVVDRPQTSFRPEILTQEPSRVEQAGIRCEILIVTYWKDIPWLSYCLQAIDKFMSGFTGVTLVVPEDKSEKFLKFVKAHGVKMKTFKEVKGRGFVHHEAIICSADEFVPRGTTHVLHLDPDCIYRMPTTPDNYFTDGKPHMVTRTVESLTDKKTGFKQDNSSWIACTEKALGFKMRFYTMCRHPSIYPVEIYKPFREHVAKVQKQDFLEYVLSCKNTFPQGFAEFPSLGTFCFEKFQDRFFWIDCSNGLAPVDRQKTYWSHAGLKQKVDGDKIAEDEIKEFLAIKVVKPVSATVVTESKTMTA